ncbi:hypothetical protein Btru_073964 [Bulinus truncatus]|nr:hypothetical protein Btru_073964 [Bulinus truncatus]
MSALNTCPNYSATSWLVQDYSLSPQALLKECHQGVLDLHAALVQLDSAGTHLTECLSLALHNTAFRCVGDVLTEKLSAVFSLAVSSNSVSILKEMEALLTDLQNADQQLLQQPSYGQILCHISLLLTKLKKQYFALCHMKMADLVHSLLCLKGEDQASGEVTKLVFKLGLADGHDPPNKSNASLPNTPWGSPKTRKTLRADSSKSHSRTGFRIMSLFERKMTDERKSSCYGEAEELKLKSKEKMSTADEVHDSHHFLHSNQVAANPNPFSGSYFNNKESDESESKTSVDDSLVDSKTFQSTSLKTQLVTEEELENVINLLSGSGCGPVSPMQVIPEIVPPQGPMQLTVPQIFCMPSPSSDTQLEDLKTQKSQVHRRSEGCLDLSSVGRNLWPYQQQHHHRASLPSVQIYSASGHKSGFETPSPVPSYVGESASPHYNSARDPPSPGYFRAEPASPFHNQYVNNLSLGMHWHPASSCVTGGQNNNDPGVSQSRVWSTCAGISVLPAGSGVQDSSDLSDDSSTEDQFFAVGKDLSNAICSKDGSSDEDVGNIQQGLQKDSSVWQPGFSYRGLTPDLLEPPEIYNAHRPIQMQWSDPLSSRSVWANTSQDMNEHKTSQSMQGFGGAQ